METVNLKDIVGFATSGSTNVRDNDTKLRREGYCIFPNEVFDTGEEYSPLWDMILGSENQKKKFVKLVKDFDAELWLLAMNIRIHGLENPIKVLKTEEGLKIGDGARRLLAYSVLYCIDGDDWSKIPVTYTDKSVQELDQIGMSVNLHHKNVNKSSLARKCKFYKDVYGFSAHVIAEKLGLLDDDGKVTSGQQKVTRLIKIASKASSKELDGLDDGTILESKLYNKYFPSKNDVEGAKVPKKDVKTGEVVEPKENDLAPSKTKQRVLPLKEVKSLLVDRKAILEIVEKHPDLSPMEYFRLGVTAAVRGLHYMELQEGEDATDIAGEVDEKEFDEENVEVEELVNA